MKLRPRFFGSFKVAAKNGLSDTLNLSKKMRTHPVVYVVLLKSYQDSVLRRPGVEGISDAFGKELSSQRAVTRRRSENSNVAEPLAGGPAGQSDHDGNPKVPKELRPSPSARAASQYHRNSDNHAGERPGRELGAHANSERAQSPRTTSPEDSAATWRPPPALLDEQGNRHYHVEHILARRRCRWQNQYLVKWRGYPHWENPWEVEVPLRQDCPGNVRAFDQREQQRPQGSQPCRRSPRAYQLRQYAAGSTPTHRS
ncbi:unnamed protein product [Phytophthora fragariaefolia]|uniref:Unnamed protein product n=1 Tax=Phytophthora fragariaefolia TaxID=1490495 RepID=A0A9W6UDH2_9STRA|nr:unnamed protein product [Phytophthora fragariaefolia]